MARLGRFACGGPAAAVVQAVVVLAALVSGCHPKRACDALPPLAISRGEGTDAEYMPGYPDQDIVVDGKPQASDESTESHRTYAMRWLQEHGEPPLVRLAGKGDAARCLEWPSYTRFTGIGRMVHTLKATRHSVQNMDRCEKGPHPFVGRRYERTTDESAWATVDRCLRESGFDHTPLSFYEKNAYVVTHGDSWFLEVVRDGRYHAILMRQPGILPALGDGVPSPLDCCHLLRGYPKPGQASERWPPLEEGITW